MCQEGWTTVAADSGSFGSVLYFVVTGDESIDLSVVRAVRSAGSILRWSPEAWFACMASECRKSSAGVPS